MMNNVLSPVKIGLALVLLNLAFGVTMGISFGVNEDAYQSYITAGITAHPEVLDEEGSEHIWRFAQRAHFHATGISAFSLGLVLLIALSSMKAPAKKLSAILVGLSGFYPLSWLTMFFLAPTIGSDAAHEHVLTQLFTYIGVGGLTVGFLMIAGHLFFGWLTE